MTNQQILEKAIQKAIDGGWQGFWGKNKKLESVTSTQDAISGMPTVTISIEHNGRIFGYGGIPVFNVIFNHQFAKALWGEDWLSHNGDEWCCNAGEAWQYHLQMMVIDPNPIAYLEANLGENI